MPCLISFRSTPCAMQCIIKPFPAPFFTEKEKAPQFPSEGG